MSRRAALALLLGAVVLGPASVAVSQESQTVTVTVQQGPTPTPGPTASPGPSSSPSPTPGSGGGGGTGSNGASVLGNVDSKGGGGDLPKTGGDIAVLVISGLTLIGVGTFLIILTRRRHLVLHPRS